MPIELVPLATATLDLEEPIMLPNTPLGTRAIVEVRNAVYTGERLNAKQTGIAADWLHIGSDGSGAVDIRLTLQTHDGAPVYVTYQGRIDVSGGLGAAPLYTSPLFETGDERYAWLNKIQAVAKDTLDGLRLTYEIYECR
jgi:hypothetical protein